MDISLARSTDTDLRDKQEQDNNTVEGEEKSCWHELKDFSAPCFLKYIILAFDLNEFFLTVQVLKASDESKGKTFLFSMRNQAKHSMRQTKLKSTPWEQSKD